MNVPDLIETHENDFKNSKTFQLQNYKHCDEFLYIYVNTTSVDRKRL